MQLQNNNKTFKIGYIYRIEYLLCKEDEIKKTYFLGLCIDKKKNKTKLASKLKKENVYFNFENNNPIIFKIKKIRNNPLCKSKKIVWQERL